MPDDGDGGPAVDTGIEEAVPVQATIVKEASGDTKNVGVVCEAIFTFEGETFVLVTDGAGGAPGSFTDSGVVRYDLQQAAPPEQDPREAASE